MRLISALAAAALLASASAASAVTVVGATNIHITNALGTYLQVAEVVATQFGTGLDKALASQGGSASAPDAYAPGFSSPAKAIDGNNGGGYYTDTIYHSAGSGGFLDVTLAAPTTLTSLTLYGRTDCCSERDLFTVSITNAGGTVLYSGNLDARATNSATVTFDAPTSVPEPASWALLVSGFAMVGAASRRRNRSTITVAA